MRKPASSQRDSLIRGGYRAEKIAPLIIGEAEPCGRGEALQAQHGANALFDAQIVMLELIVQALTRAMGHVPRELTGDGMGL